MDKVDGKSQGGKTDRGDRMTGLDERGSTQRPPKVGVFSGISSPTFRKHLLCTAPCGIPPPKVGVFSGISSPTSCGAGARAGTGARAGNVAGTERSSGTRRSRSQNRDRTRAGAGTGARAGILAATGQEQEPTRRCGQDGWEHRASMVDRATTQRHTTPYPSQDSAGKTGKQAGRKRAAQSARKASTHLRTPRVQYGTATPKVFFIRVLSRTE